MLRGITIRFARRISFRSKEFRGVDHRRKGKKLSARSLGMERLVRIEQVVSSLRLQWRRSGVHSNIAVIRASVNVTKYNRTHELSTPGIPFTVYDNWMGCAKGVWKVKPSHRRRESND